jgi:hypothetical protein
MEHADLRFELDGPAEVIDGFLQSGLVLRGNAERVPGWDPIGVTVVCLPIISHPLRLGMTTGLGEGFDALGVAVVHLILPSLGDQDDAEQAVGPCVIGVELQGPPVVIDRLAEVS